MKMEGEGREGRNGVSAWEERRKEEDGINSEVEKKSGRERGEKG